MKILTPYDKIDSIYYSLIDALRYIAFMGLVIISMILSITFYVSAVENFSDKLMLGFAAFALEAVKIYTLIFAEYVWYAIKQKNPGKRTSKEIFRVFRPYLLFTALTLLSVVASISFAQASIYSTIEEVQVVLEREAIIQEQGNPLIDIKNKLLDNKQAQLEMLNKRIADLPPDYVTSSIKLSDEVNKLNEDIYNISEEIAEITVASYEEKVTTTDDMSSKKETFNRFYLLGKPLGLTETEALFGFLTLFAILLELGIIATAPAPEKRSIKELIENRLVKHGKKKPIAHKLLPEVDPDKYPKKVLPKMPPVRKIKKKVKVKAKGAMVNLDVLPLKVKTEQKHIIKKRGTAEQLFSELYEKGNPYLKSPAQASYINNRTADEYLHLFAKLAKITPSKGGVPLVTKEGDKFKMNYAFNYIKSAIRQHLKERK